MAHWQQWFKNPCLASSMTKHTTMTNYYNGDENGDSNKNEDGNDNGNAASWSGSDNQIFYTIMMPWYCGGGSVDNGGSATPTDNYIHTLLNFWHKLLYMKFGVFGCCHYQTKNINPSSVNTKIDYIFYIYNKITLIDFP